MKIVERVLRELSFSLPYEAVLILVRVGGSASLFELNLNSIHCLRTSVTFWTNELIVNVN